MSRSLAAVILLVLGLPVLTLIAVAATGGVSADLLRTLLVGAAVTAFIVPAIFEIRRLAHLEGDEHARDR